MKKYLFSFSASKLSRLKIAVHKNYNREQQFSNMIFKFNGKRISATFLNRKIDFDYY